MPSNQNRCPATLFELARQLNLPPGWLREQAQAGKIPSLLAAGQRLFSPEAVKAALWEQAARDGGAVRRDDCCLRGDEG